MNRLLSERMRVELPRMQNRIGRWTCYFFECALALLSEYKLMREDVCYLKKE